MKIFLTLVIMIFFSSQVFANSMDQPVIGTVIKLKGESSILHTNMKSASVLSVNSPVKNNSSIVSKNSYVTIQLKNPLTFIKLGPNSKMVITSDSTNASYHVQLYTGYLKVLFKVSEEYSSMIVSSGNATLNLKDSKTLIMYNDILSQTSVINYKGENVFTSNNSSKSVTLTRNTYSSLAKSAEEAPRGPEFLTPHRRQELLDIFKISDQDKKQMDL